jgi:hypothetical protein
MAKTDARFQKVVLGRLLITDATVTIVPLDKDLLTKGNFTDVMMKSAGKRGRV